MAILYQEEQRLFTIHTIQSTYQMKVDRFGYLLHLYYGDRSEGSMEYLLTYADRGFSGPWNRGLQEHGVTGETGGRFHEL